MCGINIFDRYLKDDDVFVWDQPHTNRIAYCIVTNIDIGDLISTVMFLQEKSVQ
jgi:hypothetical protein